MATVEVYILTPNFHSDVMGEKEEFSTTMIATAVSGMSLVTGGSKVYITTSLPRYIQFRSPEFYSSTSFHRSSSYFINEAFLAKFVTVIACFLAVSMWESTVWLEIFED